MMLSTFVNKKSTIGYGSERHSTEDNHGVPPLTSFMNSSAKVEEEDILTAIREISPSRKRPYVLRWLIFDEASHYCQY